MALADALQLVTEAEERIRRAKEILLKETQSASSAPWAGGLLLADILREGGYVQKERLYELAEKYGFDKRGLGGFYTGKGSLQMINELDRVMLTPEGVKTARRYLNRGDADQRQYETAEPMLAKVAEPSFAEDWDSEEDAAYDQL